MAIADDGGIDITRGVPEDRLDDLIDAAQVARMLAVSRSEVYALMRSGRLQARRVGASWRTTRRAVQRYLDTWGSRGLR